jgi:hypothetical protein
LVLTPQLVQLSEEGIRKLADERMKEWSKDQEEYTEGQFREIEEKKTALKSQAKEAVRERAEIEKQNHEAKERFQTEQRKREQEAAREIEMAEIARQAALKAQLQEVQKKREDEIRLRDQREADRQKKVEEVREERCQHWLKLKAEAASRRQELEEAKAASIQERAIETEALEREERALLERIEEVRKLDHAFVLEHCPPKTEEETDLVRRVRGEYLKTIEGSQSGITRLKFRKDRAAKEFQTRDDQYRVEIARNKNREEDIERQVARYRRGEIQWM